MDNAVSYNPFQMKNSGSFRKIQVGTDNMAQVGNSA